MDQYFALTQTPVVEPEIETAADLMQCAESNEERDSALDAIVKRMQQA